MKILIVSGFLGAGKTTFIQAMSKATGLPFVVYENEYAGAGVDTDRLTGKEGLEVFESLENCVCCSGKADFAQSVLTIHASLDPAYLVVEPTGLARLSNLLANLHQVLYGNMELLAPTVVVDARAFWQQRCEKVFLDQLRHAGTVVVSKMAALTPPEAARLEAALAELAPRAEVVMRPWGQLDAAWFRKLLARGIDGSVMTDDATQSSFEEPMDRLTISGPDVPTPAHLAMLLDGMVHGWFGEVVRAKGCVPSGGDWLRFDLAGGVWEVTGAGPAASPSFVVIGRHLDAKAIGEALAADDLHFHGAEGHAASGADALASIEAAVA